MIPRSFGLVALLAALASAGCDTPHANARPKGAHVHAEPPAPLASGPAKRAEAEAPADEHAAHAHTPAKAVADEHAAHAHSPPSAAAPEHAAHAHPPPSAAAPEHAAHAHPPASAIGPEHAGHAPSSPGASEHAGHAGHEQHPSAAAQASTGPVPTPAGYTGFTLDLARARNVGLTTAEVVEQDFTRSLRTVGVVTLDETRTSHVHAKVRGFIEGISVDFVGKRVRQGQPLVSIYSQEVYAAELEFLSVLEGPGAAPALSGEFASAERKARELLLAGARRRLALWDVPRAEIERLEQTRVPKKTFTLPSPRTGIVVAKQALAGLFIDPSVELYLISDVRRLWVLADVYGSDVPFLKLGGSARLVIEGTLPEPIAGKVSFIPPTLDEATRTLKVRFEIDNKDGRIRPGAFATVEMEIALGRGLAIPEDAVVHAGPRAIVFVLAADRVEPREVVLGPNLGGRYRVIKGLRAGERVATGAQFLLDSESRLRASSAPGGGHGGH
jgi:membrane fusion protein, copper/silver efflux system